MTTTLAICLIVLIYISYVLLVKGLLWKIILGVFGWCGMYWYLNSMPMFSGYPLNNDTLTWASAIPTGILVLAMMYTKE